MIVPPKEKLPLYAEEQKLVLDNDRIQKFHAAFGTQGQTYIPLTATSTMMKGVFDIVNELQIDWKNLLHATQSYIYHKPLEIPVSLKAKTRLIDCKFRASLYWLSFETPIYRDDESDPVITSKSLLMVRKD